MQLLSCEKRDSKLLISVLLLASKSLKCIACVRLVCMYSKISKIIFYPFLVSSYNVFDGVLLLFEFPKKDFCSKLSLLIFQIILFALKTKILVF